MIPALTAVMTDMVIGCLLAMPVVRRGAGTTACIEACGAATAIQGSARAKHRYAGHALCGHVVICHMCD